MYAIDVAFLEINYRTSIYNIVNSTCLYYNILYLCTIGSYICKQNEYIHRDTHIIIITILKLRRTTDNDNNTNSMLQVYITQHNIIR